MTCEQHMATLRNIIEAVIRPYLLLLLQIPQVLVMEMLGKSVEQRRFGDKELPSQMLLAGSEYSKEQVAGR